MIYKNKISNPPPPPNLPKFQLELRISPPPLFPILVIRLEDIVLGACWV